MRGFGLPIVEAFSYGKAVIASTGVHRAGDRERSVALLGSG